MKKLLVVAAFGLAGCVTEAPEPETRRLQSSPGSAERMNECLSAWDARSKEMAECWAGIRSTWREGCMAGMELLGNPWTSDFQKAAMYETMRNNGCMN